MTLLTSSASAAAAEEVRTAGALSYRVLERAYGPAIRFHDWLVKGAEGIDAGAILQVRADGKASVHCRRYPVGGGGDVEQVLAFQIDRLAPGGSILLHMNAHNRKPGFPGHGFRVVLTRESVVAFLGDEQVGERPALPLADPTAEHELRLVTLARRYALLLNGALLAEGEMPPPYIDNEGDMVVRIENADLRLTAFREDFIAHNVPYRPWTKSELLYRESFTEESFAEGWEVNGVAPTLEGGGVVFHPTSVCMLKQRFEGPLAVECTATPQPADPERFSFGVSDAIFLWMMQAPGGDLFETMRGFENASLRNYLPLSFYWVDFGGTNNITTRFRRNPQRHMIRQFTDRARLLERNRTYRITLVQNGEWVEFHVDGEPWIRALDPDPLNEGYIGFRAFVAGLRIEDLSIWRIE